MQQTGVLVRLITEDGGSTFLRNVVNCRPTHTSTDMRIWNSGKVSCNWKLLYVQAAACWPCTVFFRNVCELVTKQRHVKGDNGIHGHRQKEALMEVLQAVDEAFANNLDSCCNSRTAELGSVGWGQIGASRKLCVTSPVCCRDAASPGKSAAAPWERDDFGTSARQQRLACSLHARQILLSSQRHCPYGTGMGKLRHAN
jgi:hypothetical protein